MEWTPSGHMVRWTCSCGKVGLWETAERAMTAAKRGETHSRKAIAAQNPPGLDGLVVAPGGARVLPATLATMLSERA